MTKRYPDIRWNNEKGSRRAVILLLARDPFLDFVIYCGAKPTGLPMGVVR